jgi:acyl-CoA thioester hydrolase
MEKIKEVDRKAFKHQVNLQLRFSDVDGFAHVNNAVVQEFCDVGRMHYMQKVLGWSPGVSERNDQLVVVATRTDFLGQMLLNHELEVLTRVFALGNKSLQMIQWIIQKGTNQPLAACESVMACFLRKEGRSFVLPEEWRNRIKNFEEKVEE